MYWKLQKILGNILTFHKWPINSLPFQLNSIITVINRTNGVGGVQDTKTLTKNVQINLSCGKFTYWDIYIKCQANLTKDEEVFLNKDSYIPLSPKSFICGGIINKYKIKMDKKIIYLNIWLTIGCMCIYILNPILCFKMTSLWKRLHINFDHGFTCRSNITIFYKCVSIIWYSCSVNLCETLL